MVIQHNSMVSGSPDKDKIAKFLELVRDADILTLREIAVINTNMINTLVNPHKKVPDADEMGNLFKLIPNLFASDPLDNTRTTRSSSQQMSTQDSDFLKQVQLELDSLGLDNHLGNPEKVRTQWLLESNIQKTDKDLKHAEEMSKYPAICQLKNRINALSECKGGLNSCIVNCYQPEASRFRQHADDEPYINQDVSICTFSLGETRDFSIFTKSHRNAKLLKTYTLESESVFIMQPGSQASTKHKVMPNNNNNTASSIRYSISFRGIIPSYDSSSLKQDESSITETTLIFGSSISKRLDANKLAGKSNRTVINLSVGGSKIADMAKHMDLFYSQSHEYFQSKDAISLDKMNITNVIFCIGTNDILNARGNANRLYIPLQNMLRKAKLLFDCRIHLQSMIPIPSQPMYIADAVYAFNEVAVKACRAEKCYYINVFNDFLKCRDFSKFFYVKQKHVDIHPNRLGQSILLIYY